MKKLFIGLLYVLCLTACKSGGRRTQTEENALSGPPYHVSLETPLKNQAPIDLSEIGGSINYIPLETSQNTLVGSIIKGIITDSLIFLETYPYKLMAFDHSGRFVRNYGNVGRGPGEFIQIMDFTVSPDRSKVYIMDRGATRLAYDIGGDFLHATKVNAYYFIPYNDTLFVYHVPNLRYTPGTIRTPGQPDSVSVFFSDLQGNMGKSYKYHHIVVPPAFGFPLSLYRFENRIQFFERLADTLYTVTPEALIPYAALDLGSERVPVKFHVTPRARVSVEALETQLEPYADKFEPLQIMEDKKYLYMSFIPGNFDSERQAYGFFNKQTGAVKITEKGGFTNDLDGGLPFFPKYVYNDEVLVDYVDAYVLKEHVASLDPAEMTRLYDDNYTRLAALAESLEEDSNPVMIMVRK
jgi:hypothetical protein